MKILGGLTLMLGVLLVQGCNALSVLGCGELKSRATFGSHKLLADQRTILFAAEQEYFYSCEYCAECTQRVISKGSWAIGTYDIVSNQVNILQHFQNRDRTRQAWRIVSLAGSRALVQGDTYYFFDIPTRQLTPLPIEAELAQLRTTEPYPPSDPQLLDEAGTLLVTLDVEEKRTLNTYEVESWVRHSNGDYTRLGRHSDMRQQGDNIYWWDLETRQPTVYSVKAQTLQTISKQQYQTALANATMPEPAVYIQPQAHPSAHLHIGRRQGNEWRYELSSITAEDLDW
ncbi:hypothetical protein IQ273_14450 [Nodosilinea sp. LEGE 07298]|uniref:hypothetical protein n=1 Tax=Nodosilinea sp. LEGE 07298 TaxID=2777970 RepID=UPI0018807741|nr:hypothetical protein [Nodosilinea sp. LEGE 07298]MBE9110618.1 hypothetical protein [Nodosilinea sp. LEGE 07298]